MFSFTTFVCGLFICQMSGVYSTASFQIGSVYCQKKTCEFVPDNLDWNKASAVGTFNDTILSTGWGILDLSAGHAFLQDQTDSDIMFAAGYLEGVFTARQMEDQFTNLFNTFFPSPVNKKLITKLNEWFIDQRNWAEYMIQANPNDPIWRHSSYIFAQLDGLYAGYKASASGNKTLDLFALNFLNANGDLFDLLSVLNPTSITDWTKFTAQEAENYFYENGHCSALIKILPGYENLFMSHAAWFTYPATNRIFKHYNLNVSDPATAARRLSFSSYPGYLESLDDFYILGSGLVMLETTNNVFNKSLYKYVTSKSLLAWQRVRIASMMAHSGREWTDILAKYNSGTYNNQYMVIDLKLVQLLSPLPDNTLWVAEQIPGLVVAEDLTPILRAGWSF
uniref:Phospholipase B-like n=1 Tax=Arion vulgaris TaxID=1028688 RepID=A0A0B6ZKH3_9EUPU